MNLFIPPLLEVSMHSKAEKNTQMTLDYDFHTLHVNFLLFRANGEGLMGGVQLQRGKLHIRLMTAEYVKHVVLVDRQCEERRAVVVAMEHTCDKPRGDKCENHSAMKRKEKSLLCVFGMGKKMKRKLSGER